MVGALIRFPARSISVRGTMLFRHIIVIHHGIHIAGGNQKAQTGLPQYRDAGIVLPVRLGNNPYCISVGNQNPADNGMSKRGMIHIGIPDDIDKVQLLYSLLLHIFFTDW